MLIVCNGAAKSGSTWLFNIVKQLVAFEWPAADYISHSNSKHPTIMETKLMDFLRDVSFVDQNVLSKNHFSQQAHRDLLLSDPNTRILDMTRETRDVIVSSYFDSCRRNAYRGSFADFYWSQGRQLVNDLSRYHDVWAPPHQQILVTSFERLKSDFSAEVTKIASFLGVKLSAKQIVDVDQASNIKSLRKSYQDDEQYNTEKNPFFRKGIVGDWQNHFDSKMLKDYHRVKATGIGKFDLIYWRHRLWAKLGACPRIGDLLRKI